MPTVWASVPMHAPTTTSLRCRLSRTAALASLGLSSGYSRSTTSTAATSTTWLTGP